MNAITIGIVDDQIRPFEFPADNPLFNILSGKSKRDFVAYGLTGVQAVWQSTSSQLANLICSSRFDNPIPCWQT
jgi:hypothetical protein